MASMPRPVRAEVVEVLDDAGQVADAVAVRVREAPRVDLVDDAALPPVVPEAGRPDDGCDVRRRSPSASRSLAQAGDLLGQLGLARPRALDDGRRGARHERLVGQPVRGPRRASPRPRPARARAARARGRRRRRRPVRRPDGRLDLAAAERRPSGRPVARRRLERLGRQLALERPRPRQPLDRRAERLEGRAERDAARRPASRASRPAGSCASARALRISRDELDERADLRLDASGRAPLPRASGRR